MINVDFWMEDDQYDELDYENGYDDDFDDYEGDLTYAGYDFYDEWTDYDPFEDEEN